MDQKQPPYTEQGMSSAWYDAGDIVILETPETFSFRESLVYLARSTNESLHRVVAGAVYKLLSIDGEQILVELTNPDDNAIAIRFPMGAPSPSIRRSTAAYVWDWLDLDTDLTAFYQVAKADPILNHLVQAYYGLRIVGVPDLFEALCWAITGQQINLRFAYELKRRFVETYGDSVEWNGQLYWVFPKPEDIAALCVDDLRKLQFTGKKSEYIIGVAQHMVSDHLNPRLLKTLPFHEVRKTLLDIRGIGPWTANYVLMRCFRDPSAFPIEDVGLHHALKEQLNMDRKPTIEEIRELSATWTEWAAYATFYLWRSLYHGEENL